MDIVFAAQTALAQRLDELADKATTARSYVETHLTGIKGDGAIFVGIIGSVDDTRDTLTDNCTQMQRLLSESSDGVITARDSFEQQEAAGSR